MLSDHHSTRDQPSLTALERRALPARINLADGHARHSLSIESRLVLEDQFHRLLHGPPVDIASSEDLFRSAFSSQSRTTYATDASWICYSASISIDIVGKLLGSRRARVGLV